MRIDSQKLARILPQVQKPGRYVGGEYNAIVQDWAATPVRVCLAFPDIYDLGMSNLGMAILYDILNDMPGVLAERAYLPWVDMIAAMRQAEIPLYSLESRHALADFDILGVSLPYEQLFTNLLELLDLAGLPLHAEARDERFPLVVAGGHGVYNPAPVAPFVDAFVIGDGEEVVAELVRAYRGVADAPREEQLRALARIPGVYVPRFYDVRTAGDGTIAALEPTVPEAQLPVLRRIVAQLPPPPTRLIVPTVDVSHNRAAIEIQRGCTRGCRFCHAGVVMRPVRERPVEEVLAAIDAILRQTGFDEIGLLSLSSSDYSGIRELVEALTPRFAEEHFSISLPALRADSFSIRLAEAVAQGRTTGFTFAPEAATERMRDVINKPIGTQQMLDVAREVFEHGIHTLKLYFLIGLPGEDVADVEAIADLALDVRQVGRQVHGRRTQVNLSVNTFVPKPHTPLQWVGLAPAEEIDEKQALLQRRIRGPGLKLSYSAPFETLLEAMLARGDRRMSRVVERAWALGARFDAWAEQRNEAAWRQALDEVGCDPAFYAYRPRDPEEILPWDVIDVGVSKRFLLAEYRRSQRAETLPDCRAGCHACGVLTSYGEMLVEGWGCADARG
jgi:radical SAM family uncharacterized protein